MGEIHREALTQEWFSEMYAQGSSRTVNFLMSKGFPEDDARETAQAAWTRGWERRHQIRKPAKAVSWINAIALNLGRNQIRRQTRMQVLENEPSVTPDPSAAADVEKLMSECRDQDRVLLTRRYLLGWDIGDLAEKSDCTRRAVRVRLHRARKRLRERFGERPHSEHIGAWRAEAA